jgi:putative phosphoribosyl transferase
MRRKMIFADRDEAGRLLASRVAELLAPSPSIGPVVVALPRGGVPVGAQIARRLEAPLDVVLVRKLGAPDEPELAIGAIVNGRLPVTVLNDELVEKLQVSEAYIQAAAARELAAIGQRSQDYADVRPGVELGGRTVIVVDDGVATGMTMQAAVRSIRRRQPAQLVVAVPVASRDALAMLRNDADAVICLSAPRRFGSVGSYYRLFGQVSDADVTALLRDAAAQLREG